MGDIRRASPEEIDRAKFNLTPPLFRFSLRALLSATFVCAVSLTVFTQIGVLGTLYGWLLILLSLPGLVHNRPKRRRFVFGLVALCIAYAFAVWNFRLAYDLTGDATGEEYVKCGWLLMPAILLGMRVPLLSVTASACCLAVTSASGHISSVPLLWRMHREAAAIIEFVEAERRTEGAYPSNLDGYVFRTREFATRHDYAGDQYEFILVYWPLTINKVYKYSPHYGWY